jgi:hypothetical protein
MSSGLVSSFGPGHQRCTRTLALSSSNLTEERAPVTRDPADRGLLRPLRQFRSSGRPHLRVLPLGVGCGFVTRPSISTPKHGGVLVTEEMADKSAVPTFFIGASARAHVLLLGTNRQIWISRERNFGQADVLAIRRVLVAAAP